MVIYLEYILRTSDHYPIGELPYPPYPQATGITRALQYKGIDVAIASRSPTPDIANLFLEIMGIQSLFIAQVSASFILCHSDIMSIHLLLLRHHQKFKLHKTQVVIVSADHRRPINNHFSFKIFCIDLKKKMSRV
jgi:phosphoglycolate phosphatase-like HAD superfamily hydrolase